VNHTQSEKVFEKILVPTDGSLPSLVAQELTAFLAKKLNSKVTIIHVVPLEPLAHLERHRHVPLFGQFPIETHVPPSPATSLPDSVVNEIANWYHQIGEKAIAEAVALFKEENIPVDQKLVEHADPAETILDEAEKKNYDLIKTSKVLTKGSIAKLFNIPEDRISDFVEFDPAFAIKFTIYRKHPSGSPGETDIFGCQQYPPLLDLEVPVA